MRGEPAVFLAVLLGACGARTSAGSLDTSSAPAPAALPDRPALPERCVLEHAAGPILVAEEAAVPGSARLVTTPEGFRAFWAVDVGASATPNLHTRALDPSGSPVGEVGKVDTHPLTWGPRLSAAPDGWLVGYCAREGPEEFFLSVHLGASAAARGPETFRSPLGRRCAASAPDVLRAGARELFAMTTNVAPHGPGLVVSIDVAGPDGVSQGAQEIAPAGSTYSPPRMAWNGKAIGLVTGLDTEPGRARLVAFVLDENGHPRAGPAFFTNPEGVSVPARAAIAPSGSDFFVAVSAGAFAHGLFGGAFSAAGDVVRNLAPVAADNRDYDALDLVPVGTGALLAAQVARAPDDNALVVMQLDGQGRPSAAWESPPSSGFEEGPSLALRDGRVHVLYGWIGDAGKHEVRLVVLRCGA